MTEKPPLGLMPKHIWYNQRLDDIISAIARYLEAKKLVPLEWIDEYNSLLTIMNLERK